MPHAFAVRRRGGGSRIRGLDFSKVLVVTAYVCSVKIQKQKLIIALTHCPTTAHDSNDNDKYCDVDENVRLEYELAIAKLLDWKTDDLTLLVVHFFRIDCTDNGLLSVACVLVAIEMLEARIRTRFGRRRFSHFRCIRLPFGRWQIRNTFRILMPMTTAMQSRTGAIG